MRILLILINSLGIIQIAANALANTLTKEKENAPLARTASTSMLTPTERNRIAAKLSAKRSEIATGRQGYVKFHFSSVVELKSI